MHSQQHPDSEKLDQLRTGLLDEQPIEKAALLEHIEQCASCQSQLDSWQQLGPAALGSRLDPASLDRSLQQARQQALGNTIARQGRTFVPYATAALLLIAVSIGLWETRPGYQDTNLAAANQSQDVPDLYEDLDFYLWLAEQNGNSINSDEINPNNT